MPGIYDVAVRITVHADAPEHAAAVGWASIQALQAPVVEVLQVGTGGAPAREIDTADQDANGYTAAGYLSDLFYSDDCAVCGGDEGTQYHYAVMNGDGYWESRCVRSGSGL